MEVSVHLSDHDCLELLRKNDNAAWQYLIRIYAPVLLRLAQKIVKDDAVAEDLVMDTFVKLWQQNTNFTSLQQIKKYLYICTQNSCLNFLRCKRREMNRHKAFAEVYLQQKEVLEQEFMYTELLAEIRRAVDTLPPKMRQIFILAYFKQTSNEEIANHLNLSNQTVRNQKSAALTLLRKLLQHRFSLLMTALIVSLEDFL